VEIRSGEVFPSTDRECEDTPPASIFKLNPYTLEPAPSVIAPQSIQAFGQTVAFDQVYEYELLSFDGFRGDHIS
jgi:hypothetical protein